MRLSSDTFNTDKFLDADKQKIEEKKLHSLVRFVHSFVRQGSWCWQIKFLKFAQLCAICAQLCATITFGDF